MEPEVRGAIVSILIAGLILLGVIAVIRGDKG
jgi:hypothetical protein